MPDITKTPYAWVNPSSNMAKNPGTSTFSGVVATADDLISYIYSSNGAGASIEYSLPNFYPTADASGITVVAGLRALTLGGLKLYSRMGTNLWYEEARIGVSELVGGWWNAEYAYNLRDANGNILPWTLDRLLALRCKVQLQYAEAVQKVTYVYMKVSYSAGVTRTVTIPCDALGNASVVTRDAVLPADARNLNTVITRDAVIPADATAPLAVDVNFPVECGGGAAKDAVIPAECGGGVTKSAVIPADGRGMVQQSAVLPAAVHGLTRSDHAIPVEAQGARGYIVFQNEYGTHHFYRYPAKPATRSLVRPQQRRRTTAGTYVYQRAAGTVIVHTLSWPRITAAEAESLRVFYRTMSTGRQTPFVYWDWENKPHDNCRFATEGLTVRKVSTTHCAVDVRIEEYPA